jgi:threonine dehydratase
LLSGTLLSVKYLNPDIEVIAGEPKGADDAYRSVRSGKFIPSENPQTIADGLLTSMGSVTWPIIKEHVTDIITCDEPSIKETMHFLWERMKIIVEPSSAVPLAAALNDPARFKGKRIGIIISGGNVDLRKLPWL